MHSLVTNNILISHSLSGTV